MKTSNQQEVWENIAEKWSEFRQKPSPSVSGFLKDKKGKILDLGCGSGRNFPCFTEGSVIYGVDFSKNMLKYAGKNAGKGKIKAILKIMEKEKIPYEDEFFDYAICIALLHCVPRKKQRQKIINELFRVLKPQGEALISVWSRNSPRLKNKAKECFIPWTIQNREEGKEKQERYTYIYDKEEIEKSLKKAGFKVLKIWEERNLNAIVKKGE